MNAHRYFTILVAAFGLMGLCSCATRDSAPLPAETSFNEDAGRGRDNYMRVKLHLEKGKEFNFMVDTGCPFTILKRDLEPELGERIDTNIILGVTGPKTNSVYRAPKLYLGDTLLWTDDTVETGGGCILGIDTMQNYCIQLDFTSNKMRFLDPYHLNTKELGQAFKITFIDDRGHIQLQGNFLGVTNWVIDTGCPFDLSVTEQKFGEILNGRKFIPIAIGHGDKSPYCGACLSQAVFSGHLCKDLYVSRFLGDKSPNPYLIGLPFLARYLVTFNFPKGKMYLKQVTAESPILAALFFEEIKTFLNEMAESGQLPGCLKSDDKIHWSSDSEDSVTYPASKIFTFQTGGKDNAIPKNIRQYSVIRESENSPWKLQRAWQSDANGRVVEEYPIP